MPTQTRSQDVVLDGQSLRLADLEVMARAETRVRLADTVPPLVARSRAVVDDLVARGETVYGLNTGFGRLVSERIGSDEIQALQRNLVRSHSAGVGELLPDATVRVMMGLRVNALARGFSGVRLVVLERLLDYLQHDLLPEVPSRGSVGSSGDLAPLSHIALGLLGEGWCHFQGQRMATGEALRKAGLDPVQLGAKEGLALINGTQMMSAVGGLSLVRAGRLLRIADIIGAMSVEALMGTHTAYDPDIHRLRPHPGQSVSAANLTRLMADSALVASHRDCHRVQDAYSLRCMPQVHGAARDGHAFAVGILEREINSATDNPLVFPEGERVLSGGNFHGAPVALALDCAKVALSYLGTISERRSERLLNPDTSGLPPFLTRQGGLHSGLMLVQYAAAALANENKVLGHPASIDSIPTSAGQEDHNSMGPTAAFALERLVDNLEQILACEWICAAQALEFHRPLTFGPGAEAALACLRERVPALEGDRVLAEDLRQARDMIREAEPLRSAEARIGSLS